MIRLKFFNWMGNIRKRIKNIKKFSSYHGSFVINKKVYFLKKLITPKLNGQFFRENLGKIFGKKLKYLFMLII